MYIRLNPFPVVYYTAVCEKHNCRVELEHSSLDRPRGGFNNGGSVTAIRCEKGGKPTETDCMDKWVLTIPSPTPVMIES